MSEWTDEELQGLTKDYDGTVRRLAKECLAHRKERALSADDRAALAAIRLDVQAAVERCDRRAEQFGGDMWTSQRDQYAAQVALLDRLLGAAP